MLDLGGFTLGGFCSINSDRSSESHPFMETEGHGVQRQGQSFKVRSLDLNLSSAIYYR